MASGRIGILFCLVIFQLTWYNLKSNKSDGWSNAFHDSYTIITDHNISISYEDSILFHLCVSYSTTNTKSPEKSINADAYFLVLSLLLSGDVNIHPGPSPKFPCGFCGKAIRTNSKAISCDICEKWLHIKCCNITSEEYKRLQCLSSFDFVCDSCSINSLPTLDPEQKSNKLPNLDQTFENDSYSHPEIDKCKGKGLLFLGINARSLLSKLNEIRWLTISTNPAVLCVSETWLDNTIMDNEIYINNYQITRKDRNRQGGGVCIYVRNDIIFNHRSDLNHDELEAVWVELLLPRTKPILTGAIYRPPKQNSFYQDFENFLMTKGIDFSKNETIIIGDFNTNIVGSKKSTLVKEMNSFMKNNALSQQIKDPTRITEQCKSLIDLIFVSDSIKYSKSGVLNISLSDHLITFCVRKKVHGHFVSHKHVKMRSFKDYTKDKFLAELEKVDWFQVILCENVNLAWDKFNNLFLEVINKIAPEKDVRVKQRSEPWFNGEIYHSIIARDVALKKYKVTKCADDYKQYTLYKQSTQKLIKKNKGKLF